LVSTPKAPDPVATAAAQSGSNRDTATSSQLLNMTNQVGPNGSLTYNQTGTNSYIDSLTGKQVNVPQLTATTSLSPAQQAIADQSNAASLGLGKLANQQINSLQGVLSKPFKFNNDDASNWAYDLASQRILPQQAKNEEALRSQLIASGLRPGTQAWDSEQTRLSQANTDQLNQLALNGRGQAFQEALTQYNNPVNTISALTSGAQVQSPNFVNTPQTNVAGVDYAGLVNNQYEQQLKSSQAAMGGLFGLGSSLIKAIPFSDKRLKRNIEHIGYRSGFPWYSFNYVWSDAPQEGFMAQDLIGVIPEAVPLDVDGYYHVDYEMILEAA